MGPLREGEEGGGFSLEKITFKLLMGYPEREI